VSATRSNLASNVRRVGLSLALAGLDARALVRAGRALPRYAHDLRAYRERCAERGLAPPRLLDLLPALADRDAEAGAISSEYFLADLWAARRISEANPSRHVDVGSRVDGLVAHLLTTREVEVVDIRPLRSEVTGLRFVQADATTLDGLDTASLPSVSSLHAVEHFGLGRYGDPLDPEGHLKGIAALGRVTALDGDLYLGLPVGKPRVEFNAHRVVPVELVPSLLPDFELVEFALVVDGQLREHTDLADTAGIRYGCGLYHLRRSSPGGRVDLDRQLSSG
jgi:hypothetical protein